MTQPNQSELDELLENLCCSLHVLEVPDCPTCNPKQAIEALYAPKPVENGELESLLHINGCQQRTAGYNEAKQGADGMDTDDMERLEKIAYDEVLNILAQEKAKWVAEVESTVIGEDTYGTNHIPTPKDGKPQTNYDKAQNALRDTQHQALAKLLDKENV